MIRGKLSWRWSRLFLSFVSIVTHHNNNNNNNVVKASLSIQVQSEVACKSEAINYLAGTACHCVHGARALVPSGLISSSLTRRGLASCAGLLSASSLETTAGFIYVLHINISAPPTEERKKGEQKKERRERRWWEQRPTPLVRIQPTVLRHGAQVTRDQYP